MPVSFGTPDKFNPSKGYRHVLFGKEGYLSEWELNELQKIQRASLADIAKALIGREDGVFSGTLTFNGSTVTATSLVALIQGELVSFTGTLAATTGDTIYLALTETTITKATDADLQYPAFGSEESARRIRYDISLMKANTDATKRYLTLGSIVGGNLVTSYNQLVPFADIGSDDINVTAFKSAATLLSGYPAGVSMFQYTTGDAGYPLTNAVVETYNPPNVTTGYQVITGMANGRVTQRLRQFNGTAWTAWTKDDEMEQLLARSIIAGSGLTGGGTLAASRTLSVSFGGTGTATTVARSDHNHDTTYLGLGGGTLTGNLTLPRLILTNGGTSTFRNGGASNTSLIISASGENVYLRPLGDMSSVGELVVSQTSVSHGGKLLATQEYADTKAAKTTTVSAGAGLTGGGDLSTNRTLAVSFAGSGTATTASRSDHIHSLSTLTEDSSHRLVTDSQIAAWNAKPSTAVATRTTDGLLSKTDKIIIDDGQQYRLTANDGTPINMGSNFNANDLVSTGFYMGTINVNAPMPGTSWWYVEVLNHNGTYVTQRATKFASGVAPEVHIRHMDAGKWLPWRRLADDNALARIVLGNAHGVTLTANFQSKVATSVSANPHTFRRYGHETLLAPTSGMWVEATQEHYSAVDNLDGTLATDQNTTASRYQQHLFSFDVVNYVERHFGTIPASGLAAKIAWIKANVTKYTVNWYGFGSSPAGNRANLTRWNADTNAWLDIAVTGAYTTNSTPTKLMFNPSTTNAIDANGTLHVLAYAEVSNGTIASSLSTDFIDLQIELAVDLKTTLLTQGLIEDTRRVDSGPGLSGGGDLTTNRTLSVAFGGTGSATTVARSDHNHNTTYLGLGGGTLTGALNVPTINMDTSNASIELGKSGTTNTPFIDFRSSASVTDYDARIIASGGTATNGAGTLQLIGATITATGGFSTGGAITEAGTLLSSKYAPIGTSISAGTGLTGGGTLAATRTLSVSFGGNGSATTVARSDHNHDADYLGLTGGSLSGVLTITSSGSNVLQMKGGSSDHVYLSFFARAASQATRSAFFGFGAAASNHLSIVNEIAGGQVVLQPGSGGKVIVSSELDTSGLIREQGTSLASKYALQTTSISPGSGLTGGGTLAATRTLSVNFGGTGSATTVARSDHNHDSTYVNMAGAAQTISSTLTLTGGLVMNGPIYSPVGTGLNDASVAASAYPTGLSFEGNNAQATGYPSSVGSVLNFYASAARNFQFFHAKNTHNMYLRTWSDAAGAWMPFKRLMIEDDVVAVYDRYDARRVDTGAGLNGGGDLSANRVIAVSFGGNGSATTVARSDHNHDATYVNKTGDSMSGTLTLSTSSASPVIIHRNNASANAAVEYKTTAGSVFAGMAGANVFGIGPSADISGANVFNVNTSTGNTWLGGTLSTGGAITEAGTLLSSKYAARSTSILAGAGLTGGGDLTTNRSLAVNFGGSGSATTVARSDHSHALTNITDVTITSPAAGHTLRHSGTSWVNTFPKISDNSDVTMTSIAAGEVLKWDGTKFINNTLAEAGIAARTISISAGAGLTGGGDLTVNRSLAVSFGGTGTATTVARSDHNHDTMYALRTITISAGSGLTGGGDLTAARSLAVVFGGTGSATTVARSDHSHALTNITDVTITSPASGHTLRHNGSAWVNAFPTMNDNSDITLASVASGHVLQHDGTKWVNRALSTAGIVSTGTSISPGVGLTGGGNLTTSRTLSVSFAGTGAANTVARSDHNHDSTYVNKTGDSMTGNLTTTGEVSGKLRHLSDYFVFESFDAATYGTGQGQVWYDPSARRIRFSTRHPGDTVSQNAVLSSHTSEFNVIRTPSGISTLDVQGGMDVTGGVTLTGTTSTIAAYGFRGTGTNMLIRSDGEIRAVKPNDVTTYIPVRASSFPTSSSIKYKQDVEKASDVLDAMALIMSLGVKRYRLKAEVEKGILDNWKVGVIVEESPDIICDDDAVDTYTILSLLVEAFQQSEREKREMAQDIQDIKKHLGIA